MSSRMTAHRCAIAMLLCIGAAACAGDAGTTADAASRCDAITLSLTEGQPLDWIEISGAPSALVDAVAEVRAKDVTSVGLAPVVRAADGALRVQVPLHPSLDPDGGPVELRIHDDRITCNPVALDIMPLPPAPGAFAEAVTELGRSMDLFAKRALGEASMKAAMEVARRDPARVPPQLIPALRAYALLPDSGVVVERDLLDRLAGRLELTAGLDGFRALVGSLTEPPPTRPRRAAIRQTALSALAAARAREPYLYLTSLGATVQGGGASGSSCGPDPFQLLDVADAATLNHYMDKQYEADRFVRGANGEAGGSASGQYFSDLGSVIGMASVLGPKGKAVAEVWGVFSELVLGTSEAYQRLLPSDLVLAVSATPSEFEEDHPGPGWWQASARAESMALNLTKEVLQQVLKKGMEGASLGQGIRDQTSGQSSAFWGAVGEKAADAVDGQVEKSAQESLGAVLDAIGASEGPAGFTIPPQCWEFPDLSSAVDAKVVGNAVTLASPASRQFLPHQAGPAQIEVQTKVGMFGNKSYIARTPVEVRAIDVELYPSIIRIEPGDAVPFAAVVHNALDPGVRWISSAGALGGIVDNGDGSHEAVLASPVEPAAYPIRVEAISTASRGARATPGAPVRKAVAIVQLAEPVIDIQPAGGCVPAGGTQQFMASVLGIEDGKVRWSSRRMDGSGGSFDDGEFRAGSGSGTHEIRAEWTEDGTVFATVEVEFGERCNSHFSYHTSGHLTLSREGPFGGILGINGAPSASGTGNPELCYLRFYFDLPFAWNKLDHYVHFQAALVGGLREGSYPIGPNFDEPPDSRFVFVSGPPWELPNASPGTFFGSFHADVQKHNLDTGYQQGGSSLGGFLSRSGLMVIEQFDGKHVSGRFEMSALQTQRDQVETGEGLAHLPRKTVEVMGEFSYVIPERQDISSMDYYTCGGPAARSGQ